MVNSTNKHYLRILSLILVPIILGIVIVLFLQETYGYFNLNHTHKYPLQRNIYFTIHGLIIIGTGFCALLLPKIVESNFFIFRKRFSNVLAALLFISGIIQIFRIFMD